MSRLLKTAIVTSVLLSLGALIVFEAGRIRADTEVHWVTVDAAELQHVSSSRAAAVRTDADFADVPVERMVGNIALLRLNNAQMEDLSRAMHDSFHKCSGFVTHASEQEAIEWVGNFDRYDSDEPLVTYSIDNQGSVNPMLLAVNELQNRQVIADLSAFPNRRYNQPSGWQSAAWIKNKWTQLSSTRSDVIVQEITHSNTSNQPSIVLTFVGSTHPSEIVVLGAHQDSINGSGQTAAAPGADDDASGVACLTETIRVLIAKNFMPRRTIQFMAYAAEEVGLRGSNEIATLYRNQNKNVVGVLQLDMTNYRGALGYDIVIMNDFTDVAQNQFIRDLITTYQPGLNVGSSACGYGCSDHASWDNKGYPTSFPFEATINDDNSAIHTANDTLERSGNNANHAVRFTKLAVSYAGELAKGCMALRSIRCRTSGTEAMP